MNVGLLFDATRCIGCEACAAACKEQNALPGDVEPATSAYTWTAVRRQGGLNVRSLCFHCLDPACVSVCPVAALDRTPEGAVIYDAKRCIGCRYCIMACPFDVPKYQWDRVVPIVGKCTLCVDRVQAGRSTACAEACPTGATVFGERQGLLDEARRRIDEGGAGKYVDRIYGAEEAGGTGVLMLSSVPFEELGLPGHVPRRPLPLLTWDVLSKVPDFVAVAGVLLYGLHWITGRREAVAAAAAKEEGGGSWIEALLRRRAPKGRP